MVDLDKQTRGKINEGFLERLDAQGGSPVDVIVETEEGAGVGVLAQAMTIPGVQAEAETPIGGKWVPASIDSSQLSQLAAIPDVKMIHQDQLMGIEGAGVFDRDIPFLTPEHDPLRMALSEAFFNSSRAHDPYVGEVGISDVEVPRLNFAQLPPGNPGEAAVAAISQMTPQGSGDKYIATNKSKKWMLDTGLTEGIDGSGVKASIIDTGHTPIEPSNGFRNPRLESMVPGENPIDYHGHGSWCSYTVAGEPAASTWGTVEGVSPGVEYAHMKALNTFPGFGKSSWIMRAMERSLDWGADVISMSLGGTQQGPITEEPYAKFIRDNCKENAGHEEGAFFVVAAGNSGPGSWTVGSPGTAEKAITVGSWSMTDAAPAVWSSRGPQGEYYESNRDEFEQHVKKFGAREFIKPDVAAPGGGRETQPKADDNDEYLHQAETGWVEGLFDGVKDTRGLMHGTSQATPHVAGFVARLYQAGIIHNAKEFKQVMAENGTVPAFESAAENANAASNGKNVAVGFGPVRESVFSP